MGRIVLWKVYWDTTDLIQSSSHFEAFKSKEEADKFAAELILNPDNYWIQIVSHAYENKRP